MLQFEEDLRIDIEEALNSDIFNYNEKFELKTLKSQKTKIDFRNRYRFRVKSLKQSIRKTMKNQYQFHILSSEKFSVGTGFRLNSTKGTMNRMNLNPSSQEHQRMSSISENINLSQSTTSSINNLIAVKDTKKGIDQRKSFFFQYK